MNKRRIYPGVLREQKGFSLIELLIVIIILGLLYSLVGPKMFGKADKARIQTAKVQIELIAAAIDTYRLDMGTFPKSLDLLRASNDPRWDGPYLPKDVPLDPWGNPYVYRFPGEHGPYDMISYGQDGKLGGEDNDRDIVSWE